MKATATFNGIISLLIEGGWLFFTSLRYVTYQHIIVAVTGRKQTSFRTLTLEKNAFKVWCNISIHSEALFVYLKA